MIVLRHMDGPNVGATIPLRLVRVRVGSAPDADLALADHPGQGASATHAELVFRDGWFELCDMQSRNGTFINGERVSSPQRIFEGDVIQFGAPLGPRFEVQYRWKRPPELGGLPWAMIAGVLVLLASLVALWLAVAGRT